MRQDEVNVSQGRQRQSDISAVFLLLSSESIKEKQDTDKYGQHGKILNPWLYTSKGQNLRKQEK